MAEVLDGAIVALRREHPVLGVLVSILCGYEVVAMSTKRVPTISAFLWRVSPRRRALVFAALVALMFDHLFTRRLT